ncbi:hypothetical protein SEA_SCHWARTZ33_12 [Gordonia phage Schwartz33]|nr:hypothetical protein SEA_SCHWARTZ33_12 [Gordonia phage Schwartz33]
MRGADQKLWIYDRIITFNDVIDTHRVHMMNQNLVEDFMILNTKITTKISSYYVLSNTTPLSRSIKSLIDVTIKSESRSAKSPMEN